MRERTHSKAVLVDGVYIITLRHCGHQIERKEFPNLLEEILYDCEE